MQEESMQVQWPAQYVDSVNVSMIRLSRELAPLQNGTDAIVYQWIMKRNYRPYDRTITFHYQAYADELIEWDYDASVIISFMELIKKLKLEYVTVRMRPNQPLTIAFSTGYGDELLNGELILAPRAR